MTNTVLITGASGLIGQRLTEVLLQKGCRVFHLGRSPGPGPVPSFRWDPAKRFIDDRALEGVDTIVNLAGAGIADKRWSAARKEEILSSRVNATSFLAEVLKSRSHAVTTVVSASAIGYYGFGSGDKPLTEEDAPGSDFLASVVVKWEKEAEKFESLGLRQVRIRIGIVLSNQGGALKQIALPVRFAVGAPLGNGNQIMSWIHVDDLCDLFAWAVQSDSIKGIFNAAAPHPVSNRNFIVAIARQLGRPVWLPAVPGFVLRLLVGEMADLVIFGSRISSEKAMRKGFAFRFPTLEDALKNLFPA